MTHFPRLAIAWMLAFAATAQVTLAQTVDHVRISKLTVNSDSLPDADRQRLASSFEKSEFVRDEVRTRVERATQGMGYITAVAEQPQFSQLPDGSSSVTITVHQGSLYRLADIQFVGADDFAPEKLRGLFPMNDGDRFESAPIGAGLNKLMAYFVSCGYSQAAIQPAMNLDSSSSTVHFTLDVAEGPRLAAATCR